MNPESGRVLFDDGSGPKDVHELEGDALTAYRRNVQFIFQDPFSSLNPRMTVYELLTEPLRIHDIGTSDERYAARQAIARHGRARSARPAALSAFASPAGSGSASASRARWRSNRAC